MFCIRVTCTNFFRTRRLACYHVLERHSHRHPFPVDHRLFVHLSELIQIYLSAATEWSTGGIVQSKDKQKWNREYGGEMDEWIHDRGGREGICWEIPAVCFLHCVRRRGGNNVEWMEWKGDGASEGVVVTGNGEGEREC